MFQFWTGQNFHTEDKSDVNPPFPVAIPSYFSFQEVFLATNSFSSANVLEKGDFWEVYKGDFQVGEIWDVLKLKSGGIGFDVKEKVRSNYHYFYSLKIAKNDTFCTF